MGKATQTTERRASARPSTPPNVARVSRFFTDLFDQEQAQRQQPRAQAQGRTQSPGSVPGTRQPLEQIGQRGPSTAPPGGGQRRWPVDQPPSANADFGVPQTITGGYGNVFGSKPHDAQNRPLNTGLDVTARAGTSISAVIPGTVEEVKRYDPAEEAAGRDSTGGYGNTIVVRGDDGLRYRYSHMAQAATLRPGQRTTEQPLGLVGDTGNATGPHLDLEITDEQGNYLDGAALIRGDPQVTRLPPRGQPDPGPYQNQPTRQTRQPVSGDGASSGTPAFPVQGYKGKVNVHWGSNDPGARGGADIMAAEGTPVVSMVPGTVEWASTEPIGGNNVGIRGDDGKIYYYAHLRDAPQIQRGQRVERDQPLGAVGKTGNAAGGPPHLHIGIGQTEITKGSGPLAGLGAGFDATTYLQQALDASQGLPAQAQLMSNPTGGRSMATPGLEWLQPADRRRATPTTARGSAVQAAPNDGLPTTMYPGNQPNSATGTPVGPIGQGPHPSAGASGGPGPSAGQGAGPHPSWTPEQVTQRLGPHADRIRELAQRYKVDPAIIASIMLFESGGRPNQTSPQGAQGVMQVMPDTAAGLGFDPNRLQDDGYNLEVGTAYLAKLLQRQGKQGDYDDAIAAYINGRGLSAPNAKDANGTTAPVYLSVVRGFEQIIKRIPEATDALGVQSIEPAPGSVTQGATAPGTPGAGASGIAGRPALQRIAQERRQIEAQAQQALTTAKATHTAELARISADPVLSATPDKKLAATKAAQDALDTASAAAAKATADRQSAEAAYESALATGSGNKPGDQVTWQNGRPYRYVLGPDGKMTLEPIAIPGVDPREEIDPNRFIKGQHPNGLGEGLFDASTGQWVYTPQESELDAIKRQREGVGLEKEQWELGVAKGDQAVRSTGLQVELEQAKETLLEARRKRRMGAATEEDEIAATIAEAKIKQLEAGHWEEDFASDEAAQQATTAGTEATTAKTNLEAAALQRKEENWAKIKEAWAGGASMEDINRLVLQSAQDVDEYVKLQAEDRARQTQAETQRSNLATEELTRQQRRKEDVGQYATAMESYGRFGVASTPWQTSVLTAAAPLQGVASAAQGMGIKPDAPFVQGIQKQYDDYSSRQANTAGAAREAYGRTQGNMFGLPSKKGPDTSGGASSGAGANYGTTNPPPTTATQPGPGTPGVDMGASAPISTPPPAPAPTGTGGTGGTGAGYDTAQSGAGRTPVQGKEALDLNDPAAAAAAGVDVQPGKAATVYANGEVEIWDIPSGGGWLPQPTGVYGSGSAAGSGGGGGGATGGGGEAGSGPIYSQGRRLGRKRRPVEGKQAVDMGDGKHVVTHYDDGSKEIWALDGSGPSWEGVGGGGSGYWFDRPTTYGVGHTGGGGASVWQLPPGAETSMNQGLAPGQTPTAQQVQAPPPPLAPQSGVAPYQPPPVTGQGNTTTARFPTPMAGGYGGPAAAGGGNSGGGPIGGRGPWATKARERQGQGQARGGGAPMPPMDPAMMDPAAMAAMGAGAAPPPPPGGMGEPPPLSYNGGGLYTGGGAAGTGMGSQASAYQAGNTPAPMWDAAVGAGGRNMTTGPGGQQGSATLYSRPGAGLPGGGGSRGPTNYGGPVAPAAITPLQRLMQQSGLVPRMAGQAAGSPGGI